MAGILQPDGRVSPLPITPEEFARSEAYHQRLALEELERQRREISRAVLSRLSVRGQLLASFAVIQGAGGR
jgi:hypothetical protein